MTTIVQDTRTCRDCKTVQPVENFYVSTKGYDSCCKPCRSTISRASYAADRGKHRAKSRKYYARFGNSAEFKARKKAWSEKWRYGVTPEFRERLWAQQQGLCAICEKAISLSGACLDHRHIDGQLRGLLCRLCNAGLGTFEDSPELLRRAANYLDRWGAQQEIVHK